MRSIGWTETRSSQSNHINLRSTRTFLLNLKNRKYSKLSICDRNLVRVNAIIANGRCIFSYRVKTKSNIASLPLPVEKTTSLKDRTATEFSYQSYAACY